MPEQTSRRATSCRAAAALLICDVVLAAQLLQTFVLVLLHAGDALVPGADLALLPLLHHRVSARGGLELGVPRPILTHASCTEGSSSSKSVGLPEGGSVGGGLTEGCCGRAEVALRLRVAEESAGLGGGAAPEQPAAGLGGRTSESGGFKSRGSSKRCIGSLAAKSVCCWLSKCCVGLPKGRG